MLSVAPEAPHSRDRQTHLGGREKAMVAAQHRAPRRWGDGLCGSGWLGRFHRSNDLRVAVDHCRDLGIDAVTPAARIDARFSAAGTACDSDLVMGPASVGVLLGVKGTLNWELVGARLLVVGRSCVVFLMGLLFVGLFLVGRVGATPIWGLVGGCSLNGAGSRLVFFIVVIALRPSAAPMWGILKGHESGYGVVPRPDVAPTWGILWGRLGTRFRLRTPS